MTLHMVLRDLSPYILFPTDPHPQYHIHQSPAKIGIQTPVVAQEYGMIIFSTFIMYKMNL
jgi:hypothetical protein